MIITLNKEINIDNKDIDKIIERAYYGVSIKNAIIAQYDRKATTSLFGGSKNEAATIIDNAEDIEKILKPTIEKGVNIIKDNLKEEFSKRKNVYNITFKDLFIEGTLFANNTISRNKRSCKISYDTTENEYFIIFSDKEINIEYTLRTSILDKDLNEFGPITYELKYIYHNIESGIKSHEKYNINDSIFNLNPYPLDDLQILKYLIDKGLKYKG